MAILTSFLCCGLYLYSESLMNHNDFVMILDKNFRVAGAGTFDFVRSDDLPGSFVPGGMFMFSAGPNVPRSEYYVIFFR